MSVLEDLRAVEQRVAARLDELRPLVDEYEELMRIADRLGIEARRAPKASKSRPRTKARARPRAAKAVAKPRARASSSRRSRPGGTRATGAERRERVLALIAGKPGITVSEISKEMGVDAPQLYRVVRKLQSEGLIKKQGTNLRSA
jgi:colicin import membrane protein